MWVFVDVAWLACLKDGLECPLKLFKSFQLPDFRKKNLTLSGSCPSPKNGDTG